MEKDNYSKDNNGGQKVGNIGQVLSVKSLSQGSDLVGTSDQQVNQSNQSSLILGSAGSLDSSRRERFPDDSLANVGGNEEGDTRSKTITSNR